MIKRPQLLRIAASLVMTAALLSGLTVVSAQTPLSFKVSPSTIPAGRTRTVKIKTEPSADLTGFEVQKPRDDSGVTIADPELIDNKTTLMTRVTIDEDADEQILPLKVVKKKDGKVVESYSVDLTIAAFAPKTRQKEPVPSGLAYEVDGQFQPMAYDAAKDVFGRRIAKHYYVIAVNLGNNTGFDLQINKIGFITTRKISVPKLVDGRPVFENGSPVMVEDLLAITAIDRSLVRSSIERDQTIGPRAIALNLLGGVGTLTTGFLPFFHALGPRANFSSFSSLFNGQLKDGFTAGVPDLTIAHLNRLDNRLVMDQDFVLPNNSERNTVVFVPRATLKLPGSECNDLLKVKEMLGQLVLVGRKIDLFANRQIVVHSERPSLEPGPFAAPAPLEAAPGPVSIARVTPDLGLLSDSTDVIITGAGFTPGKAVKVLFGDRQTTGVALSSTTVQATVPPNATAVPINVKVIAEGDRTATLEKGYSYVDELKVESVESATGAAAGGTVVKIKGKGFISGAEVKFGDVAATSVSVSNDHKTITATIPAHAAGQVAVIVKNPNSKTFSLANGFTYTQ